MKIWERYFLKEIAKVFFLFIGGFYFLYILIDYSAHTKNFHQEGIRFSQVVLYYAAQLLSNVNILVPFAFLIATAKVLTTLNARNEMIALVTSGTSLKRMMRPFFLAACVAMCFLYLDFECLQPRAWERISRFEEKFFGEKIQHSKLQTLIMEDDSLLIYKSYDPNLKMFCDLFWIQSLDHVVKMHQLDPFSFPPIGFQVYAFSRSNLGTMELTEHSEQENFDTMRFDPKTLFAAVHPPKWQSISHLYINMTAPWKSKKNNPRHAQIATAFYYKLSFPLVCVLIILGLAPVCVRFDRKSLIFLIFSFSLFALIAYFTVVNASIILGESHLIAPIWAVFLPPIICSLILGWRYAKF